MPGSGTLRLASIFQSIAARPQEAVERRGGRGSLDDLGVPQLFGAGELEDIRYSNRNDSAPELKDAIIGHPVGAAKDHPGYLAAKSGDPIAAIKLALDLTGSELLDRVRELAEGQDAVLLPIISVESNGNNKIPQAVAEVLSHKSGLQVTEDIVQSDSPMRTSMDGLDRIFSAPEFDGPVKQGIGYILVDDTITQGATFASLASHIRQNGGHVLGVIALTGKQYSAKIQPSTQLIEQLRAKFGDIEPQFQAATGYGFDALTESEARYLTNFKPPDTVRARIIEAGYAALKGRDAGDSGPAKNLGT